MSGAILQADDLGGRGVVEDAADVVIVGTGAAGGTTARVLTEAGLDVVLIEEGPWVRPEEIRGDVYTGCRRVWRDGGFLVAQGRSYIPVLQGRCVGGSTAINSAIAKRLPEDVFEEWRRDGGLGELRYRDLERAWDVLEKELSVVPTPESAAGGNNLLLAEAAARLGWEHRPTPRSVEECRGYGLCLQGCPSGQKRSMDVSYVPRAVASGARVYATCRADRVEVDGGRAAGVRGTFWDPATNRMGVASLRVRARRAVVVAASAVQTPLLLKASGIGRRSGLVGRRFQTHPATAVIGTFDRPVRLWLGASQGHESREFWEQSMLTFQTIGLPLELGAARLPGLGPALMEQLASYENLAAWGLVMRSEARGSVRRAWGGGARIDWDPTDQDVRIMKRGVEALCEAMFAAGAREVFPGVHGLPDRVTSLDPVRRIHDLPDDPRILHCITSHMFGTAVMGARPADSVVGPDGQCHELPGLYVADSSVFPTPSGVNPQHSICGMSWVLAERLAGG